MTEPMTPEELEDATRYVAFGESTFDKAFAEERNLPLLRRLLDENARLNAELADFREMAVLNTKAANEALDRSRAELDKVIREAAADKAKLAAVRKIKAQRRNSAMVTSEQLATMHGWNDAVNAIREALEPCTCTLTDPSTWETYGGLTEPGSTYQWEPDCPAHGDAPDAAPEMPRPPAEEGPTEEQRAELIVGLLFGEPGTANETAQEPVSGPETAGTGSGRGTGITGAPGAAQVADDAAAALWCALQDERYIDDWYWQTEGISPEDVQAAADSTKSAHYREAAASLWVIAAAARDVQSEAYINGIEYAAGRLDSAAKDLDAEVPSLPVPGEEA